MPAKRGALAKGETLSPGRVLSRQLKRLRKDAGGMSQQALADRVQELGGGLERVAIAKIENGQRGVSLDEALVLVAALGLDPNYALLPIDADTRVALGTELAPTTEEVRAWLHGLKPLPGQAEETYYASSPDSLRVHRAGLTWLLESVHLLIEATRAGDRDAELYALSLVREEIDRQMRRTGFVEAAASGEVPGAMQSLVSSLESTLRKLRSELPKTGAEQPSKRRAKPTKGKGQR
jgi:transcriptional regulator with XRE-family HTH domain